MSNHERIDEEILDLFRRHMVAWLETWPLNSARAEHMAKVMEETAEALRNLPDQKQNYDLEYSDLYGEES
jgi:hypothetical protein